MKTIKKLYIIFLILFFTALKAEINNFEKGKNLFSEKKYDLAKFKFEQDIVFNLKMKILPLLAKIYNFQKNDEQEEAYLKTVILLNPKKRSSLKFSTT